MARQSASLSRAALRIEDGERAVAHGRMSVSVIERASAPVSSLRFIGSVIYRLPLSAFRAFSAASMTRRRLPPQSFAICSSV